MRKSRKNDTSKSGNLPKVQRVSMLAVTVKWFGVLVAIIIGVVGFVANVVTILDFLRP
jgi:hypothetical protein